MAFEILEFWVAARVSVSNGCTTVAGRVVVWLLVCVFELVEIDTRSDACGSGGGRGELVTAAEASVRSNADRSVKDLIHWRVVKRWNSSEREIVHACEEGGIIPVAVSFLVENALAEICGRNQRDRIPSSSLFTPVITTTEEVCLFVALEFRLMFVVAQKS